MFQSPKKGNEQMEFMKKLFSPKTEPGKDIFENGDLAKNIGMLLNDTAKDVFLSNKMTLLEKPLTFIVPAVWGATKEGILTETQKNIHNAIDPVVQEILNSLSAEQLSDSQKYAIGFILRDLVVSKIVYMIQIYKNALQGVVDTENIDLVNTSPVGEG
jgi:hypothetical protein